MSNSKHYRHKIILVKKTRINGTRRRSEEFQLVGISFLRGTLILFICTNLTDEI